VFKSHSYEKIIKEQKIEQTKLKESLLLDDTLNVTYTVGKSSPEKNVGFMDSKLIYYCFYIITYYLYNFYLFSNHSILGVDLGYKTQGDIKPIGYAVCYAKKGIHTCVQSGLNLARNSDNFDKY
jgi:hypothetical protein